MADPDISDLPSPNADIDISDLPDPKRNPASVNAARDFGGDTLQVYNPAQLWNDKATNFDTHIPLNTDWQNAAAGAGKAFSDLGSGIHQLGHKVAPTLVSDPQDDVDDAATRDKDLMGTKAGIAGNIAGTMATGLLLPEAGMLGSAGEGAALGALEPTTTGGSSRLQNSTLGALGGAAGAIIGKGAKILQGFGTPAERQASVNTLRAEGIPISVAQQTNAKEAQHIERASGAMTNAQHEFEAAQQPAFNRAIMRRIGWNSKDPMTGADVLNAIPMARQAIKDTMNRVADNNDVAFDNTLLSELAQHEWDAGRMLAHSDMGAIHTNMNDILEAAVKGNGSISGRTFQKIYSNLGELSKNAAQAPIAGRMRESLRQALLRSASPQDAADYAEALRQYRALKQIAPAVDDATGNISVLKLIRELGNKNNENQALYGKGDQSLINVARAAAHILPDRLGNSGTPERMFGPLTVMEVAQSGKVPTALMKAAVTLYGGAALGRAMRNQGIAGKIMANGVPGVRNVAPVVARTAAPLGVGAAESQRNQNVVEPFASGGRATTTDEQLVDRLMRRYKAAKAASDRATKPLLRVPDETIIHALKITGSRL